MRPPVKRVAMMKNLTTEASPKKIASEKPLCRSPNFPICEESPDPFRSKSSSPSTGPAGDVSPPGFEVQRHVDAWGDTFVPETEDVVGDDAAGNSETALWAACVVPDTYEDSELVLSLPSPVASKILSGSSMVDTAVADEERKQEIWEEKMLKMLDRMKAKEERRMAEKVEAAVAAEKEEQKWDDKIDQMLARMKAKEKR